MEAQKNECKQVAVDVSREADFVQALKYVQWLAYQIADNHGWHDLAVDDGTRVALIHSEASELLESMRNWDPPSIHIPEYTLSEEEAADIIIRVMDLAQKRGYRLGPAIMAKVRFNNGRPYRHGGKRF